MELGPGMNILTGIFANFSQSWLSAILSANSVCLHISLVKGFNIAWWYHATRADARVADLPTIWIHGTSSFSALKSGRSFNYIALAALFVATVPLNGFILQTAISVDSALVDSKINMTYTTRAPTFGLVGQHQQSSRLISVLVDLVVHQDQFAAHRCHLLQNVKVPRCAMTFPTIHLPISLRTRLFSHQQFRVRTTTRTISICECNGSQPAKTP